VAFAHFDLHERLKWNVAVGFALVVVGTAFAVEPW